ncbi:hypothetical protein EPUS_07798 [Endocarpon pusillum Z07020]|uniref:C2H2-type domain-containing protein n=1 Tax=Endocarpon pusillum (strain Z07020 / HMAS-L-300199) TaxID=1263415 RepID=U1HZV5_ENDPU|nr:uncharacterized protein EPUS_07798 [Endocarpon pusillum Z07020]ERF75109.1 hypothetical protein EPUS_07798 [Endocarpon pusillum Z07020]
MNNNYTEDYSWQSLEGDQSWVDYGYASALPNFQLDLPLGYEPNLTAPWASTNTSSYYVQNNLGAGSSLVEPQQNLVGSYFHITGAEGGANGQNACFTSEPRETVLPNVDTAVLYPAYMQGTASHHQVQQQEQATDLSTAAIDFQFVGGSRPLQPLAAKAELPSVAQRQDENSEELNLKCKFPGCVSKKSFKRKYELERHMQKHSRQETFDCPAVNCKYRGPKAFYRPDKLKAHVLAGHDEQTLFACPVAGCFSASRLLSRAFLSVHMRNHDLPVGKYRGYLPALGSLDRFRTCPVEKCLKKLSPDSLQGHVLQHTEAERAACRIKIAAAGLDHLSGCVICPIISCRITLPDLPAFQDHLIDHIALDPNHFRAWKTSAIHSWCDLHQHPWVLLRISWWDRISSFYNRDCPACGMRRGQNTHPFDLLKDPKNLHACREEILQLYPGIGWHPIFDDVMPAVHRTTIRLP